MAAWLLELDWRQICVGTGEICPSYRSRQSMDVRFVVPWIWWLELAAGPLATLRKTVVVRASDCTDRRPVATVNGREPSGAASFQRGLRAMVTFSGKLALASALATAAVGASAQISPSLAKPQEVITQIDLPYFRYPQDINGLPLGHFAAGAHVCLTGKTYSWSGIQLFQYVLPSGQLVYTSEGKGIFAHAPEGDRNCISEVASTNLPDTILSPNPPVGAPLGQRNGSGGAPNGQLVAGNGTPTFLDDAMRADLKEVVFPNGVQKYTEQNALLNASDIGNYFYLRHNLNNGNGVALGALKWSTDKDIQDFVRARRWYQMALNLDLQRYPSLADYPRGMIELCNFELSNASGSYIDQRKQAKEAADKNAEEEKIRQIAALLKKDIGDNLCDISGNFAGQVEQVYKSKVQMRVQRSLSGILCEGSVSPDAFTRR